MLIFYHISFLDLCTNQQQKLVDLSVFLMNKFGKSEDMSRVVLQQASKENAFVDVMVSFVNQSQFSEFKIPKSTKNNIERYFVLT